MIRLARRAGQPFLCVLVVIASFLFPQSQTQVGYTLLAADPGSSIPIGTALFTFTDSEGILVSQAGVAAAEPILSGCVFVDESGPQTGIALVNPSSQDASVTFVVRDSTGKQVAGSKQTLGAGKHFAKFLFQFIDDLPASLTGSLTFESDQKLAAIALRQNANAHGEPLYSTLPVFDLASASSAETLVFPQIAAGGGYTTQLLLINTTVQTLSGTITLTDSDGNPLALSSNGQTSSQFSYSIDPHGTYRADFDRSAGTKAGYALLTPDSGTTAPSGSAVFEFRLNQHLVTEAAVAATSLTSSARIFVDNVGCYTGVALANPAAESATVTFTLLDRFGSSLDTINRTLPPKGHIAIFAHELFPGLSDSFTGLMDISSRTPVAPITLKFLTNARSEYVLTTLPVADLTRLPTARSVVFPQIALGGGFTTRLIFINPDKNKTIAGKLSFFNSDSTSMTVPLGGNFNSEFSYQIASGGGRQLFPGNTAAVASISLLDPDTNRPVTEVVVDEGQSVRPALLVRDSTGLARDDFDLSFSSLSNDVAAIDTTGNIQGRKAGFSTLAVSSGSLIAAATITVVTVNSGVTGFEITGVAQDRARRLYLADSANHSILLLQDLKQAPTTYAGVPTSPGLKDDTRLRSLFRKPSFLALDQAQGILYIGDTDNNVIRRVQPGTADKVETLAGTGAAGSVDGAAEAASFNNPQGVALDSRGFLWVADSGNHTIRRVNISTGVVDTVAGRAGASGWQDGKGEKARFNSPAGIALEVEPLAEQLEREAKGEAARPVSILVADKGNGAIRRVLETGEVETVGSSAQSARVGGRMQSRKLASSTAAPLAFSTPEGIAVDQLGNIYVSEPDAARVRIILASGEVLPATQPKSLLSPRGVAITQSGHVVVGGSGRAAQEFSYGEPKIASITPDVISNRGGDRVTIKGSNFAPETTVVTGGVLVPNPEYRDSQTISFVAPSMPSGRATLTVQHRGGLAQIAIAVDAAPLSQLSAGQITTIAGGTTFAGDGSAASSARLNSPVGVAVDKLGNIFVADWQNHRIRKVAMRTGIITSVAGTGQPAYSGDNGPATAACLDEPEAVAVDGAGNLLIADSHNYRIRKVSAETGIISTIAGGGEPADGLGDNGPAAAAAVSGVSGIAVDQSGNIYLADTGNNRIRRIDSGTNVISTFAGNGTADFSGDKGLATQATLNAPAQIALDSAGNLFIADTGNNRVRRVDSATGVIATVAGDGTSGSSGDGGPATAARLVPASVDVDADGNLFIADAGDQRIRKVDAVTGTISTVAGGGSGLGDNGPAGSAGLRFVHGISFDGAGNLYIADTGNHRLRMVAALTQIITTLAGGTEDDFVGDGGPATAGWLNAPLAIAPDASGNLYIADTENNRVRRVDAQTRKISTFAGTGEETFSGDGGLAAAAAFVGPAGIAFDSHGNVFISAYGNSVVMKVDKATGILTIVAGSAEREGYAGDNGPATQAALKFPQGIAIDSEDNLFIADSENNRIRKVEMTAQVITTVAGGGSDLGDNGLATSAALDSPLSVAVDRQGDIYIADTNHNRVRKVSAGGIITTVAGNGGSGYSGDGGPATAAEVFSPKGIALDDAGNLYIAGYSSVIRRVDAKTQIITTIAGNDDFGASGDNGPATAATLGNPYGVALDGSRNLYIADTWNHRIRAIRGPLQ
jgi:sugar lactone lactonase YvrE